MYCGQARLGVVRATDELVAAAAGKIADRLVRTPDGICEQLVWDHGHRVHDARYGLEEVGHHGANLSRRVGKGRQARVASARVRPDLDAPGGHREGAVDRTQGAAERVLLTGRKVADGIGRSG